MRKNTDLIILIYGNDIQAMVQRLIVETGALDSLRPHDTVVIKPQNQECKAVFASARSGEESQI